MHFHSACGQLANTADLHPSHPSPALQAFVAPSPKSLLNPLLLQWDMQMLLSPWVACQGHGCLIRDVTESQKYKISGWTLHRVTQPARATGESAQTTRCWCCVCKGSPGQRSQLIHTEPGCCQWFFIASASAIAKQWEGWG